MEWCRFFELEMNEHSKEAWYLAQIAAEVRRTLVKDPGAVKVDNFLLTFTTKKQTGARREYTEEEKRAKLEESMRNKAAVMKMFGFDKKVTK